jgi:hydrogenase small subunit
MRRQGISRRSFLKYCSLTATSLGPGAGVRAADRARDGNQAAHAGALAARPGMHLLLESFIRSAHPLAKDVVLSMISLDYDDTMMAAAGHQAEARWKRS